MVLIIAEDAVARTVYGELFVMRGYDVVTAVDPREGFTLARDPRVAVVVLALTRGAAQLRRKLNTLRPLLRVHVLGRAALPFDALPATERRQLH